MAELYSFEIGNDKDVKVIKQDTKVVIVIREISTEQNSILNTVTIDHQEWHQFQQHLENASNALSKIVQGENDVEFMRRLSNDNIFMHFLSRGKLFIQVHSPYRCVTIREFVSVSYQDQQLPKAQRPICDGVKLKALKIGVALRELEWMCLKQHMKTINEIINLHNFNVIFKYGDIIQVKTSQCIVQQCDCITINNHGLSKKISEKYPWADIYKQRRAVSNRNLAIQEDRGVPGTIKIMVSPECNEPDVICMLAQWDFGRGNIRQIEPYKDSKENRKRWFKKCLTEIGLQKYQKIAFPFKIGCGLGQGNWTEYLKMIKDMAKTYQKYVIIIVPEK